MIFTRLNSGKIKFVLLGLLFFVSCREGEKRNEVLVENNSPLKSNDKKADSILNHFWDRYDFTDTNLIKDPNISEQALVDFINRFHVSSQEGISAAVKLMLEEASESKKVRDFFVKQYDRYLYDPNSPMRDDFYYQLVLKELVASPYTGQTDKIRYRARLDLVKRNMPGSEIVNFKYVNSSDSFQNLHDVQASNKLLVFYDPGCPHCQETIKELRDSYNVNDLIKQGKLKVVAICPIGNYGDWKNYQTNIPANWINGFDREGILIQKRLYDLKAFPTMFLIDNKNRVILKDTDLGHILDYLVV